MSEVSFTPGWRVIAKTPPGEIIVSLTECDGQVFAATSAGVYRLAQRRKGQYKFVPVLFSAAPEPVRPAQSDGKDAGELG